LVIVEVNFITIIKVKTNWHIEDTVIQHIYIKSGTPRLNGKVERSHRTDENEFYQVLASGTQKVYNEIIKSAGLDPLGIRTEWGRVVTGPYGWLVTRAIHKKEIYRSYI
jgi:diaminopimelate decarboxylase